MWFYFVTKVSTKFNSIKKKLWADNLNLKQLNYICKKYVLQQPMLSDESWDYSQKYPFISVPLDSYTKPINNNQF